VISPKRRIALAVALTLIAIGGTIALTIVRIQKWNELGWAGISYLQADLPPGGIWGMKPGGVIMVYPDGPADEAGFRQGDVLLAINGVDLKDVDRLRQVDRRVRTGDVVVYRVARDGVEREYRVRFASPMRSPSMVLTGVVNAVVAFSFITIGLLVLTRSPHDRRAVVLHAMTIAGALSLLASLVIALDGSNARGILTEPNANLFVISAAAAMTFAFVPLTLHLALVFPKDRPILRNRPYILGWVYGIPVAAVVTMFTLILTVTVLGANKGAQAKSIATAIGWLMGASAIIALLVALVVARRSRGERLRSMFVRRPAISIIVVIGLLLGLVSIAAALKWGIVAGVLSGLTTLLPFIAVALFPIFSCVALYRSYKEAGPEERRQVKWPLWGILIALSTKIFATIVTSSMTTWVMASGGDLGAWMPYIRTAQIIPTILYLLIPISFAVAILKYRLMNIDVIIKKTVVYAILSGAIIVLYLVLVGGLGTMLVRLVGLKNQTMVIVSTLVVAVLFVPLRNRLQQLVDRNLFRQKIDYPQALRAISADTLAASDLKSFLNASVEKLQQALQNRSVVIFQRRGEELIATAKIGVPDSVLGSVAIRAETAQSFDRPLDPRKRTLNEDDASALRRVGAALVIPIRTQGSVVAVMALGTKLSDRDFDLEDIEFASSAADQIGIGIDRIRTQHDEADFEQARTLQQGLMPTEAPRLPGVEVAGIWQPARTVGGDYYDMLKLSETQLGICIGDVAGKGMPAALLMSGLQAAVRASADPDVPPSRVVERVRRVVVPSLAGRFVSFFYCTFDTTSRRLRYCNAGHNPPLVARADGTCVRLSSGGPVLSRLFRDVPLNDSEIELGTDDRLVLFTDGVSEARDAGENDYTEERLEEFVVANRHLGARELAAAIASAVAAFAGGHPEDDLTLVTLATRPPIP
jgi:hypothetical protein